MFNRIILVIVCAWLGGCASIVSGTSQAVFVETPMAEGAACKLSDSKKGTWYLPATPGSVTVQKGDGPMNVVCEKAGYTTTTASVEEGLANAMWANTIIWWGYIVDAATGAAQKYPDKIVMWMKPTEWKSPEDEAAWNKAKADYEAELRRQMEQDKKKNDTANSGT